VYLYTGGAPRTYADYVDNATGHQLEAQPGTQYEMRAVWDKLPVPPADGFWETVEIVKDEAEAEEAPKGKRAKADAGAAQP
jgi:hypothetical protein